MAQPRIKLSQMSTATTIKAVDTMMIVQDGVNKVTSISNFLKNLNSADNIRFNSTQLSVNFSVASKNDANALYLHSSSDRLGVGTSTPESKFHVNGNGQFGSSSADGVVVQSTETITYTSSDQTNVVIKPISPNRAGSELILNTGVNGLFSLPSGSNGQTKSIVLNAIDIGKTAKLSLVGAGFNEITLNAVGESVLIQYFTSSSKWYVIGGNGYTVATV